MEITALDVVSRALKIANADGVPDGCNLYCTRCLISRAQSELCDERCSTEELLEQTADGLRCLVGHEPTVRDSDASLIEAREALAELGDKTTEHTQESAIASLERALWHFRMTAAPC